MLRRTLCPALRPYVGSIVVLDRDDGDVDQVYVLPDTQATLLFNIQAGVRVNRAGRFAHASGNMALLGAPTRAGASTIVGVPLSIVVTLKATGAHALTGMAMDALTDRSVELSELWGEAARRLIATLTQAASNEERLMQLEQALIERLSTCSGTTLRAARLVAEAMRARTNPHTSASLDADVSAAETALSARHVRRLVKSVVGVGPRTLQRIERFNHAVRLARAARAPHWADIAAQCGYYDQAHMIGEFNDFVAVPPGQFLSAWRAGLPHLRGSWFEDILATN